MSRFRDLLSRQARFDSADSRNLILRRLLDGDLEPGEAAAELRSFDWDSPEPLVDFDADVMRNALRQYIDGHWSEIRLRAWADLIDMRDDVRMPTSDGRGLREMVFEVASPDLFEPMNPERAQTLLHELEGPQV